MLLSVIVPVYNGETYLNRCIDSVEKALEVFSNKCAGSFPDNDIHELILIDDGSTDGTSLVCTELRKKYQNIKIITLNDDGVSVARNKGLDLASGEFISFVDADDVVDENIFAALYDVAEDTNNNGASKCDIVGCGFYEWSSEEDLLKRDVNADTSLVANGVKIETVFDIYEANSYIVNEILNGNSRCWSKLFRRSVIDISLSEKNRFIEGLSIGEDMIFVVNCALMSKRIGELRNYKGYGYYKNPKGAMNKKFTPGYMDQIRCWEYMNDILASKLNDKNDTCVTKEAWEKNLNTKYIMAIMLVVSKIACLDKAEMSKYLNYVDVCKDKLKLAMIKPYSLDNGYKVKTSIFRMSPKLYLNFYHSWKNK